jgi:anaerobic selenocysteine-containing dehydrogenase
MASVAGRTVFHFHTRTKTRRAPKLNAAAPQAIVEVNPADAAAAGVRDGDTVRVTTRRGHVLLPAKVTDAAESGCVFIPFHYGYFDSDGVHRCACVD